MKVNLEGISPSTHIKVGNKTQVSGNFEAHFKAALKELDEKELLSRSVQERIELIHQRLEQSSKILERFASSPASFSTSQTVGEYLIAQAFETNKLIESLPDSSLKSILKEWCLFVGVEGQKIRQGFYLE